MTKKYIRQSLDSFTFNESSDLGVFTLDDAINYLEKIKFVHPEANQFYLRVEKIYYLDDELNCFIVEMERLETDKEYNKRIKLEEKESRKKL